MTHKLILKVKMFQVSSAKPFGTAGGKPLGGVILPHAINPFRANGGI